MKAAIFSAIEVIRKIAAFVVAAMMIVAMAVTVMAAPTDTTITIPATDNHTYSVYQIFTGELNDGKLSNVHWGANGTGTEGDLVPEATLETIAGITGTDTAKAEALKAYANLNGTAAYTVSKDAAITVPTGYYLIKDATATAQGDEATLYILQVVGPTEITRKAGTTESDKKLDDRNDSTGASETLKTSSDYDIGDYVPYHLTATLSEKVDQYHKYHITFEDTLEAGKFDDITTPVIKMNDAALADTDAYTVTTVYNTNPSASGFKVTIEFTAKGDANSLLPDALDNANFTIDFTARLGTGAVIGGEGNHNTLHVEYSNNPNDKDGGEVGTTPDKTVVTFTYKVVVDKTNGTTALAGAGFTLYKIPSDTAAPTGDAAKDAASKNAYYASKKLTDSKGEWTTTAVVGDTANVANRFSFDGIDDGTYVLCETTTPAGYNTADPIVFTVTAEHSDDAITSLTGEATTGEITFTASESAGSLSTTVVNRQGSVLPSTGGIGTTMFYIIGAILVLGAAVLLVTKKRVSAE